MSDNGRKHAYCSGAERWSARDLSCLDMIAGQRAVDAVLEAPDQITEGTEFSAMRKAIVTGRKKGYVPRSRAYPYCVGKVIGHAGPSAGELRSFKKMGLRSN